MTRVAVFVPGIMGSVLELQNPDGTREVVWPGSVASLVLPYNKMAQLMSDDLIATDVIRRVSFSVQYQQLIDDLARCGFRETVQDGTKPTLYLCPYDWRGDNARAADVLADKVDAAVAEHGAGTQVTLIGHSMGGLVGRYYLESGDYAARPGFPAVRELFTLGTPHRGAPLALSAALGQEKRLFLSAAQVRRLASDTRFTALYQLLPPRGEPFAWADGARNAYGVVDIYDPQVARSLGLVAQNLRAAEEFHAKLDLNRRPQFQGAPVRYFFFVGTRQMTYSAVKVLDLLTNPTTYRVTPWGLEDAGDGTVPAWSGALTGVQGHPVGGEHGTIYRNDVLLQTLGALLGAPGVLAARPEKVEVSLRERVVKMAAPVHIALTFGPGVDRLDGKLVIQRAQTDAQGVVTFSPPVSEHPITYSGLNAERLNVVFSAPGYPDVYRVAYIPSGHADPAGSDELFVQQDI
jgi:pimeloyl-ACP methyl ester carboxylesterase